MEYNEVMELVEAKGTLIGSVTFEKLDGSLRTINCLFKPSSKIVGSERGVIQGDAMAARGQIPIYDLQARRWKSFYANKLVELK